MTTFLSIDSRYLEEHVPNSLVILKDNVLFARPNKTMVEENEKIRSNVNTFSLTTQQMIPTDTIPLKCIDGDSIPESDCDTGYNSSSSNINDEYFSKRQQTTIIDNTTCSTKTEKDTINLDMTQFNSLKASTVTIIAVTNWYINIDILFDHIKLYNYEPIKRRPRNSLAVPSNINSTIKSGDIITVKYNNQLRGYNKKKTKKAAENNALRYFKNSMTISMYVIDKIVNFKISKGGKFQITGCKHIYHAFEVIKCFWERIQKITSISVITICGTNPRAYFITVMTNVDFNMGFNVNRENLDRHINCKTKHNSLFETSFGYTGVNLKLYLDDWENMRVECLLWDTEAQWIQSSISYREYLHTVVGDKERQKIYAKKKFSTILVFTSGSVIISTASFQFMETVYREFMTIVTNSRNVIEDVFENKPTRKEIDQATSFLHMIECNKGNDSKLSLTSLSSSSSSKLMNKMIKKKKTHPISNNNKPCKTPRQRRTKNKLPQPSSDEKTTYKAFF